MVTYRIVNVQDEYARNGTPNFRRDLELEMPLQLMFPDIILLFSI